MDCTTVHGSSVHGIFQARLLEWVATSFFRGSSWPRDWTCGWTCISWIFGWVVYRWANRETPISPEAGRGESRLLLPRQDVLQVSKWFWLGSFRSLLLPCVSEHVIFCVFSLEWSVYILQPSGSPGIQLHWPSKQNVLTCLTHERSWTGEPGVGRGPLTPWANPLQL